MEERRTRVVHNWLQYFERDALRMEVGGEGLEVEEVLGGVTGAAYDPASCEFAVIARRMDRSC